MKIKIQSLSHRIAVGSLGLLLLLGGLFAPCRAEAVGTWTPLVNTAPGSVWLMLLLSDGTVLCANNPSDVFGDQGNGWFRLTPDAHGSYVNGTWTTLTSANDTRLFYSSDVLRDGRVFVAGGEYGSGKSRAEVYDPVANSWTLINPPTSLMDPTVNSPILAGSVPEAFLDSISKILPDGRILVSPVAANGFGETMIYNPVANSWSAGPTTASVYQDEASWVKLPDDSILTIDPFGQNSERYIPSLNRWIADANVPVPMYDSAGSELGAAFLLADGRAFFLGASGHTAFYTPSGNTNNGTWTQGPDIPTDGSGHALAAQDAPAAMMVNGKILCAFGHKETSSGGSPAPTYFFEYDPVANSWAATSSPGNSTPGSTDSAATYQTTMLDLPDGTVLYSHDEQGNLFYQSYGDQLYVYTPDGSPLPAGKPTITSITMNPDGSFHLVGTGLNGISEGAAFGDDAQMNSNFPQVRLIDGSGNVYYARTYNWSSTSVMTGTRQLSTDFSMPLLAGSYSLVVVGNGFASDPITFYGTVWVDFNYSGIPIQLGTFVFPYNTLAQGVSAVPSGGTIAIKPGTSSETMTISKPMKIIAVGGAANVGE